MPMASVIVLSVTIKSIRLNVIMLSVVMLNVVAPLNVPAYFMSKALKLKNE
jgi:hypothetical protein